MVRLFRKAWWKYLSIPLILYALIAGILIPLGPGITDVEPASVKRGAEVSISVYGYNTHFEPEDQSLDVILKNSNNLLCANIIDVISPNEISAEFGIPGDMSVEGKIEYYNVIVTNDKDGTFFQRDGFAIEKEDTVKGVGIKCTTNIGLKNPQGATFPNREILYESIRNLFFHVPMWFTMIFLLLFSFANSIFYLSKGKEQSDLLASQAAKVAILFGILGILTGMQWANATWGAPWVNDPRLNGAAVGLLVYFAYFVLRGSLENEQTRAKVSAVYNVFAFVIFIVFIFVIPRMTDSLHPGSGGNPGFNSYDLDNNMRPVFYSGVVGFIILSFWILSLVVRHELLLQKINSENSA